MRAVEFKRVFFSVFGGLGLTAAMSVSAADPLKVGFVYTGPVGDHGWTYQHDQGRKGDRKSVV